MTKRARSKYVIDGRDPTPGEAAVYVLRDPNTGEAKYVGQTTVPLGDRLSKHWHPSSSKGPTLRTGVDTLEGPPRLEAVMYVPAEQGRYWEAVIIAGMLQEGARLVNVVKVKELCGTPSGARTHQRAKEPVCYPCWLVNTANVKARSSKWTPEQKAAKKAYLKAYHARKKAEAS